MLERSSWEDVELLEEDDNDIELEEAEEDI